MYFILDHALKVRQLSGFVEARALKYLFFNSFHNVHSSLRSHKDVDPINIRKRREEFLEDNFAQKSGGSSEENSFPFVEIFNHSLMFDKISKIGVIFK
jgi:hypothetical protein